jgi:hypothetical protein
VAGRKPSLAGFREDPLYPRIARAVEPLLQRGNVVAPVDMLIPKVEEAYVTHFVWPGKGLFHPPAPKEAPR